MANLPASAQTPAPGSRPIVLTEIEQFGGAERSLVALSRWLWQHNLPNHLVAYADRCNLAQYAPHPMQVIALNPTPGARNKIAALRSYFRSLPHSAPRPLLSGYQTALHGSLAGMRGFHVLMHDTPSLFSDADHRSLKGKLRIAVSNRVLRHGLNTGGVTFVNSEFLRDECRRDFGVDARIVRMGGLPFTSGSAPENNMAPPVREQLSLFSVSRIEFSKRIDWMLRSLARLERDTLPLSSRIDWRLDLAGQGPRIPELTAMAQELGIGSRVHFHGFVSDHELDRLFSRAHLFLMPAIQGYGIPAIESLQRGVPVLVHRDSGVSDILLDTPWATVFHGGEDQMTGALRTAIDGVLDGKYRDTAQPKLPTEEEWAERVSALCGWV